MPKSSYTQIGKLSNAKAKEFSFVSSYKYGYRNREDITNLPAGVLIVGSQNVMTNVSDRIQIRQGYALDGSTSSINAAILSSFDWQTKNNNEQHLRAGFLTSSDGKLQYRYEDSTGTVTWRDLLTGLSSVSFNFTTFWNTSETLRECLFVNGTSQIQTWNGAVTTYSASTSNTLTKEGTPTWASLGFYGATFTTLGSSTTQFDISNTAGNTWRYTWDGNGTNPNITSTSVPVGTYVALAGQGFSNVNTGAFLVTASDTNYFEITNPIGSSENNKVIGTGYVYAKAKKIITINDQNYCYSGGEGTTTLTGVFPNPSIEGIIAGDIIHQTVIPTPNSTMTSGPSSTFANGLISVLNNQIYLASLISPVVYISKIGSYTDYGYSNPRQVAEGDILTLDANIVSFKAQEDNMYVSAGKDLWYNITFDLQTSTVGVTYEQVNALPLKTGKQQGAISQAFVSHMKNNIIMVTNEPTIDMLGRIENYFGTPQTKNISDSIKLDVDKYDFTGGSIFYFKYYIYVAIPVEGLVLIYNLATGSWEAPQILPISRFYIVDGELYGHSSQTSESYKLFTGYADRVYTGFAGYPINAIASFSYESYGSRFIYKKANAMYVEGYINQNTILNITLTYELDGCATTKTFTIDGSDSQVVCIPTPLGSLGKDSLGKEKLGGAGSSSLTGLPPKFRAIPTFDNTDFFECSISFSVLGTDNRFELLAFGLNASGSSSEPVSIKQ